MNLSLDLTNWKCCCTTSLPETMIMRLFILLALVLTLPGLSFAQSTDEAELRFYDVEVVIFKNIQVPKGKELILPVSSPRRTDDMLDLSSPASLSKAKDKSYQRLADDRLQLRDRVAKIVKSPYYDLLLHVGWRQPGLEKEASMPVWIRGGKVFGENYVSIDSQLIAPVPGVENSDESGNLNASEQIQALNATPAVRGNQQKIYELEGVITVALSRYLHTYTDLVLRRPRLAKDEILGDIESSTGVTNDSSDTFILNNHALKEHRRMRSKTLHYLDSPEFGLLVLITPYEATDVSTAAVQ